MANNRIYYAIQQVRVGKAGGNNTVFPPIHGLQSVGITTNFNLEQVFEMGQLAIYQNVENVPDVEVTLNKVLDGYPLIYVLATEKGSNVSNTGLTALDASIAGRQNARCDLELSIFPDTQLSASGNNTVNRVVCSGMYVSSVSYTFPVDGNFTEDVTLVGNNKVWGGTGSGLFSNDDQPAADSQVGRRQFLNIENCRFPTQIPGINDDGVNTLIGNGSGYGAHFQNITVSCDFGREAIQELGTFAPYHRFVTFPVEVTSEFEVVSISGDMISATEEGYYSGFTGTNIAGTGTPRCSGRHNLLDQTIFLETCEGTKISLGNKNKLTSVNYTGGDTGGGNVTVSYSYTTFNDFVVAHSGGSFYNDVTVPGTSSPTPTPTPNPE
jgi:hypothetical protein